MGSEGVIALCAGGGVQLLGGVIGERVVRYLRAARSLAKADEIIDDAARWSRMPGA